MKRNVSLAEISDGRLYGENDMVRADCHGCNGCSECCRGMGSSIILDPYDVYRLTNGLGKTLPELMDGHIELNVVDGVILPNLRMAGEREQCSFLDEKGRCSIHSMRPGICRLFPLGRYYENGDFRYFLQTGECDSDRGKIKVKKWIDTPDLYKNHQFIVRWHYLLNQVEELVKKKLSEKESLPDGENPIEDVQPTNDFCQQINLFLLQTFYMTPYDEDRDFYEQFDERVARFRQVVPE